MISIRGKSKTNILMITMVGLMTTAATASATCSTDAANCAVNQVGNNLACAAAGVAFGAVPFNDDTCVSSQLNQFAECRPMLLGCPVYTGTQQIDVRNAGLLGQTAANSITLYCDGSLSTVSNHLDRMTGVEVKRDTIAGTTLVSSIRMNCLSGLKKVFIGNDGLNGATFSSVGLCSRGHIAQGLVVRAGAGIDALGTVCRKVGFSSTYNTTLYGGSGGALASLSCPANKYLKGLKVWFDGSRPLGERNAAGIQLLCQY